MFREEVICMKLQGKLKEKYIVINLNFSPVINEFDEVWQETWYIKYLSFISEEFKKNAFKQIFEDYKQRGFRYVL